MLARVALASPNPASAIGSSTFSRAVRTGEGETLKTKPRRMSRRRVSSRSDSQSSGYPAARHSPTMAGRCRRSAGGGWTSTSRGPDYGHVLPSLYFQRCTPKCVHSRPVHGIVLLQVPGNQNRPLTLPRNAVSRRWEHGPQARPDTGPPDIRQTAPPPGGSDAFPPRDEEGKGCWKSWKAGRMLSRYRAVPRPRTRPMNCPTSVSTAPSISTCRTIVDRATPMARRVAISPRRSLTVMVSRVLMRRTERSDSWFRGCRTAGESRPSRRLNTPRDRPRCTPRGPETPSVVGPPAQAPPSPAWPSRGSVMPGPTNTVGEGLHDRQHGTDRRLPTVIVRPAHEAPDREPSARLLVIA